MPVMEKRKLRISVGYVTCLMVIQCHVLEFILACATHIIFMIVHTNTYQS